ncbi:hypothetical protein GQX74_014509 [Glossina fuscipes]|nr:hypothetical protein GQX74_014509 [Glossina fuscipes]
MAINNLVSKYTKLKYRNHKSPVNNDQISNILNREFSNKRQNEVIVSDLTYVQVDRGNEFKNKIIEEILLTFNIKRSLSAKGCPYDNAVAETTYKAFKTEFINGRKFKNLEQLKLELFNFIN